MKLALLLLKSVFVVLFLSTVIKNSNCSYIVYGQKVKSELLANLFEFPWHGTKRGATV